MEIPRDDVTPERAGQNSFVSAGMARKLVPVIDALLLAQQITEREYYALDYYREQASRAQDDICETNVIAPERIMGGDGCPPVGGYTPAALLCTPAVLETSRIERDLGSLREIAFEVAVRDITLAQWCITRFGGRERYDAKGRFIAIVPLNEKRCMRFARQDLRMAALRITR